jgi:cell division protein FtsB
MLRSMRLWLVRRWHLVLGLLLLAYFAHHGVHGERGLLAWIDKSRELQSARAELATLDAQITELAGTVEALQPDRSDPDLLEEQLRNLGFIGKDEVIVLTQPRP